MSNLYKQYQVKGVPINQVVTYMSGNSGLTEQFIYHTLQHDGKKYTVLSSSPEEDTKMGKISMCELEGKPLKVFEGKEGLLVVRNGNAGTTIFLTKGDYTINDHAYILFVKDDCPYKINLKWLGVQYKHSFLEYSSSSDNGTWNMTGFFQNVIIDIPKYEEQLKVVSKYDLLSTYEYKVLKLIKRIEKVLSMQLVHKYKKYQAKQILIKDLMDYMGGNSGLTEKFIYQQVQNVGKKYYILSGATTKTNEIGSIVMCDINGKPLRVFENKEGLLVIRKGKAGKTRFLEKGEYTLTDDAYILYIKDNSLYRINLKWLSIQYQQSFLEYASSSDNGTWNMTGFFENVMIDIPDHKEQLEIVEKYQKIEGYESKLKAILKRIQAIFSKTIV